MLNEAVLELLLLLEIVATTAELAVLDSVRRHQASIAIRARLVRVRNSLRVII